MKSGASEFICADILDVLADRAFMQRFDFASVSPPCQRYSRMSRCRPEVATRYPDLIPPARKLLLAAGVSDVIENVVVGAPPIDSITLCMWMFGREAYSHRQFERGNDFRLATPPKPPADMPGTVSSECGWPHPIPAARAGHGSEGRSRRSTKGSADHPVDRPCSGRSRRRCAGGFVVAS